MQVEAAKLEKARELVNRGETEELSRLIEECPELTGEKFESEGKGDQTLTLLLLAAGYGQETAPPNALKMIEIITAAGGGSGDRSPCEIALLCGSTALARELSAGDSPLSLAVAAGIGDVDAMAAHFENGQTLVLGEEHIESGTFKMVKALEWPLLLAVKNGQIEAAFYLLKHGADINRLTAEEAGGVAATSLHWASRHGHYELVKFLVSYGAGLGNRDDRFRETPSQWAKRAGHERISDYLSYLAG
ncbi:MAG: ankyrin repeat domain-containing protein [Candidatus Obscuribacterales bacterium]